MLTGLISALPWLIGKGAIKAHVGGVAAALVPLLVPLLGQGADGFMDGLGGSAHDVGRILGEAAGRYLVGYAAVWLSPKNREA